MARKKHVQVEVLFDNSAANSYSEGTTQKSSNPKEKRDKWLLPADWKSRCQPCRKCGADVVFLTVDGTYFPIDVAFAYRKKTTPRGCRVTSQHQGKLCIEKSSVG